MAESLPTKKTPLPPEADDRPPESLATVARRKDAHLAVRNAFILGGSLIATWSVALVVRLVLPRTMGPEVFGRFNWTDAASSLGFVFVSFGVDTYIMKELPVRPKHGSDFFGGTFVVRLLASLVVFAVIAGVVATRHQGAELQRTAAFFGLGQLALLNSNMLASMLQASRTVGRLAVYNIVSKVFWGAGVVVALMLNAPIEVFAASTIAGEGARGLLLYGVARRNLHLSFRVDWKETLAVLRRSAPYYVNIVAVTIYARVDVFIMELVIADKEVGWYGAAANFSSMAMLLAPLMVQVLMPQLSRAAAQSHDELMAMLRRTLELLITLAVPISLTLLVSADVCVPLVFGPKYHPSILALQILAPMFTLTYLAMMSAMCLTLMGRGWTVTVISISSVVLNALLNVLLLRPAVAQFGEGAGGAMAAAISVSTEVLVTAVMLHQIGRRAFDRANVSAGIKSLVAAAVVITADYAMHALGPIRIALDMLIYAVLIVATGAMRPKEILSTIRAAIAARRGADA